MSLVGYARVSTVEGRQILDRQLDALRATGCERVFKEHGSGANPDRSSPPASTTCARATSWPSSTSAASGGVPRSSSR